jgi:beta-lactamase regulating signal transducer with metallopeptidase domain
MRVTFILSLFREDIIRAFFWTLVHSLWQGLALAMFTGLVILLTRRSTPVLRYNILLGSFCLFMVGAGTTFFLQLRAAGSRAEGPVQTQTVVPSPAATAPVSNLSTPDEPSWNEKLTGFFNRQAELIVVVWGVILFIRLVKLLVNLGNVQRLRYYRTSAADEQWQQRVRELARRIGIKRAVQLLQSSLIPVPMMAGIFKPVILVPLGLLSQLPPQQVEAILLHELAHIRRKDYVINLVQSIAEILFFFNPAVLWISSLIREERENCCDDIAVGETCSKREFIHALVSFQEYTRSSSYVLAFPGSKNHLLERVKRIVHHDNKVLNLREKLFLLVCVFITAGLTMAYARKAPAPVAPLVHVVKPVQSVKVIDKKVGAASADTSRPIKPEQKEEWERMTRMQQAALAEQKKRLEEAEMRLIVREKELAAQQERLNDLYADALARAQELRDSVHGRADVLRMESAREIQQERLQRDLEKQTLLAESNQRKVQREMEMTQRKLARSVYLRDESAGRRNKYITPIIDMLLDRKLISSAEELSFSLDKEGFTVNGQRQPDEIFQSFREAFLHDPQDFVRYSKKGKMESTTISKHSN